MRTLVIAEHDNNTLDDATCRVVSAASQLGHPVDVIVPGHDCQAVAESAASIEGVDQVLVAQSAAMEHFLAESLVPVIVKAAAGYTHIMAAASTTGKNILPGVAALLDVSQISEITAVISDDTYERPVYAGNAVVTVRSADPVKVITVRCSAFDKAATGAVKANISMLEAADVSHGTEFIENRFSGSDRPALGSARIVISGGRGLGSRENFAMLESLADRLGAAIGASRAAVDAGYVGNEMQVGQTGKIVAPELYMAIGISGAIQHLAGMKDSKVIVAVNQDADAPIFQVADYGLVTDLFTFLPEFEAALDN